MAYLLLATILLFGGEGSVPLVTFQPTASQANTPEGGACHLHCNSQPGPKIAFHVSDHAVKARCSRPQVPSSSQGYVTQGSVQTSYDVYLILAHLDPLAGLSSVSLSLEGDNPAVFDWVGCAEIEKPIDEWPAPYSSLRMEWNSCPSGEPHEGLGSYKVLGSIYTYAYGYSWYSVAPHASESAIQIETCLSVVESVHRCNTGIAVFGEGRGCNPCLGSRAIVCESTDMGFGNVAVGQAVEGEIQLINRRSYKTSGFVSLDDGGCGDFRILDGGGEFTLDPGEMRAVSVEFAPTKPGEQVCTLLSVGCAESSLSGVGVQPDPVRLLSFQVESLTSNLRFTWKVTGDNGARLRLIAESLSGLQVPISPFFYSQNGEGEFIVDRDPQIVRYGLEAVDRSGTREVIGWVEASAKVFQNPLFQISSPRPNPFQNLSRFVLELRADSRVELAVVSPDGRLVKLISTDQLGEGTHRFEWDGTDDSHHRVSSGVYFLRARIGSYRQFQKMVYLGL